MAQTGRVISIKAQHIFLLIGDTSLSEGEAPLSCCTDTSARIEVYNPANFELVVGDMVSYSSEQKGAARFKPLSFSIPIVLFFIGYIFAGQFGWNTEATRLLAGLIGAVVGAMVPLLIYMFFKGQKSRLIIDARL